MMILVVWPVLETYCAACFCRRDNIRAGSSTIIHKTYNCKSINVSGFCSDLSFKVSAVTNVDSLKIIIVPIYHFPTGDPKTFLKIVGQFLIQGPPMKREDYKK